VRTPVVVVAVGVAALGALIAALFWFFGLPRRLAQLNRNRRRESGIDALEAALLAAAGGDPRTARREARRAQLLLERDAGPRLIAAQAAEAMGDLLGAETQYAGLLADARTEIVGRRGLAAAALSRRDYDTAILHATQAFGAHPAARWAFDLLFDAQVQAARWEEAIETLTEGGKRKHLTEDAARRRRSVLLAAAASGIEASEPQRARDLAEQSASLAPAFAPGAALAARLLLAAGKSWRAAGLLEDAWTAAPHPAIALAYRDLRPEETEKARAKRMLGLAEMNAEHRESRIIRAEQALGEADGAGAETALAPLMAADREPSARLCGLAARAAQARGDVAAARRWTGQATLAAGEPDWSDLDPEGPAFAYTREDWARLVYSFGDTGKLIHPRHERFERERLTAPTQLQIEGPEAAQGDADASPTDARRAETPAAPGVNAGARAVAAPVTGAGASLGASPGAGAAPGAAPGAARPERRASRPLRADENDPGKPVFHRGPPPPDDPGVGD
jgi:HemY protein